MCGHSVAQECAGLCPTTTQTPRTAQLSRAWSFFGWFLQLKNRPDQLRPGRPGARSSGQLRPGLGGFWTTQRPPRPPAPAWPGARSSRGLAMFVCGYKQPKPPSAQLVHAPGRPGRGQVHLVEGYMRRLVASIWPEYVSGSMRVCQRRVCEYVAEYVGLLLIAYGRQGGGGGPSDGACANARAAQNFLVFGNTAKFFPPHLNVLRFRT